MIAPGEVRQVAGRIEFPLAAQEDRKVRPKPAFARSDHNAAMAGWALQLESATTIDGKQVNSIQVSYRETVKLEKLENKRVRATGKIAHRHGVETGEQPVLEVSSMKEIKGTSQATPAKPVSFSLSSSAWLLEDPSGSGVLDNIQATLTFPEAGKAAGNGSCNRFFGSAEINGDVIKLGPLGSSQRACPEA